MNISSFLKTNKTAIVLALLLSLFGLYYFYQLNNRNSSILTPADFEILTRITPEISYSPQMASESLTVSGIIEDDGKKGKINTIFLIPKPIDIEGNVGDYSIEYLDKEGQVVQSFYFKPYQLVAQGNASTKSTYAFSLLLPFREDLGSIQLKNGPKVLHKLVTSSNVPRIEILPPVKLTAKNMIIDWRVDDKDRDKIAYEVWYSQDQGNNWRGGQTYLPLTSTPTNMTINWDLERMGIDKNKSLSLLIIASDGIKSGRALLNILFVSPKEKAGSK